MTPLALEMLIWFCVSAPTQTNQFHNMHLKPQQETRRWFYENGIVDRNDEFATATDKGRAWLDMICETPMPVQRWLDPRSLHAKEEQR